MKTLRLIIRIFLFIVWSIPVVATQTIFMQFHTGRMSYKIPRLWHAVLCKVFGLDVRIIGTPLDTNKQPVLFISNHISYLDILAIGSRLEASFVAKNDIASWPVFGYLCKMQQTAFIFRNGRDALKEKSSLESYLKAGKSIILFPEGTTTDGTAMLPFKSSLFALALHHELTDSKLLIQPFSVRARPKPGISGDLDGARVYPWYGDMTLVPHLAAFGGGKGCIVELIFHDPIDPKAYDERKSLSQATQTVVSNGLTTGLPQPAPLPPAKMEQTT